MHFTVQRRNGVVLPDLAVVLNLPGRHNVLNALSAIAVAVELNVPDAAVQKALADFKGVGRRFQRYGEVMARDGGVFTLVDDYGHHPVEMAATLAAARGAFPDRRLVLAFQPHRYTRTRDCFEDFVKVIAQADAVLLAEVYAPVRHRLWQRMAAAWRVPCAWQGASNRSLWMTSPICPKALLTTPGPVMWCCAWGLARLAPCRARCLICYKIQSNKCRKHEGYESF